MPRIIDVTSSRTRKTNAIADGFQQSLALALPLIDRLQRQNLERERMAREDREFGFRQQQAERGFQFQTQQADRQQGNTDRAFDQRQQVLDRQFESEDAAAAFYRDQILERSPGPVDASRYDGMDSETLKGILKADDYAKQSNETMLRMNSTVKEVIEDLALMATSPQTAERMIAKSEAAVTIQEMEAVEAEAWEIGKEIETMRADAKMREADVMEWMEVNAPKYATNPAAYADVAIANRQYQGGKLTFSQWVDERARIEKSLRPDGGRERPTTERLGYAKAYDDIMLSLARGDITEEQANEKLGTISRFSGVGPGRSVWSGQEAAPGGAASPVAVNLPRAELDKAAKFVGQKGDAQAREDAALDLAPKLLRDAGLPVNRESIARAAMQILQSGGGKSAPGLPSADRLQGNM